MATTNTYHVSSVAFPEAEYDDRYISIDQTASTLEQGFQVNSIDALSGARDSKINNYSSFYMTGRNQLTNFLTVSSIAESQSTSLITRLGFERPGDEPTKYLYIFKNNLDTTDAQKALGVQELNTTGFFDNNFFFEIEALNNNLCRIKHNNGLFDFYLNYNTAANVFVFYQNTDNYKDITKERNDVFRYALDDDGYLQLFKFHNDVLNVVTLSGTDVTLEPLKPSSLNRGLNNLIHIDYNLDQNKQFLNKSFAAYNNQKTANLILNTGDSSVDEKGQYLFVANYNSISADKMPLNYLTLDSNRSEFNFVKRGSNMVDSPLGLGTDPREYYNIYAGNDQEKGLTNLNLNYSFYDKDVFITNGTDTYFTAPSSIYPYEKLNINDTQFTFNGAFAGPSPKLSDKIFIKRQNTTQFDNGRYLCTWLSGSDLPITGGVWVDRYYYPDKISKAAALSSTASYAPSFYDSVDSVDLAVTDAVMAKEKFFDKKSDAAIVPNANIKYQRIGNADITELVNSSSPIMSTFDSYLTSKVVRGETENICNEFFGTEITYGGDRYSCLEVSDRIDTAKNFTLNFDMYLDPSNQYGFALMGNNSNKGFGVFQDQTVTPFIHVVSDNTLFIYNTDFTLLNKVDFKTKIKNVFKRSALDDYIVTTAGNLYYKVNSQGNKIKLECGSDILDYYGSYQMHDNIDFISSDQQVRRINTNTFSVSTLSAAEFDVYENEFCLYDNVIEYNDTVYKLPGSNTNWENDKTVFYQVSSYIVKHNLDSSPEAFLKSDVKDFTVVDDKIYILKPTEYFVFNTSGVFELSGSIGNITIPSPVTETTVALSGAEFISIDWVNEYRNGVNFQYPVMLAKGNDDILYLTSGTLSAAAIPGVTLAANTNDTKLTNYNVLNHIYDANTIDFKLTLRNYLNSEDILTKTISFLPEEFEPGFYNFTYRLDTKQGNSSLYINGELYENQTFAPGKYLIQDIFSDEFFIGSTGFQSNLDLSTYLKQPGYYYTKDLTVRNPFIYDRAIDTELVYALYLFEKKIDDIVLSIPAGQRTSKTEIQQFFKFNRTNSSNHIDVVVRNLNITDTAVRDQIKTSILAEANSYAPVGVKINDVKFLDY